MTDSRNCFKDYVCEIPIAFSNYIFTFIEKQQDIDDENEVTLIWRGSNISRSIEIITKKVKLN